MKVISRAIGYKTKCRYCGSIIMFDRSDILPNENNDLQARIKCPVCQENTPVTTMYSRGKFDQSQLFDDVETIYEEEKNPINKTNYIYWHEYPMEKPNESGFYFVTLRSEINTKITSYEYFDGNEFYYFRIKYSYLYDIIAWTDKIFPYEGKMYD